MSLAKISLSAASALLVLSAATSRAASIQLGTPAGLAPGDTFRFIFLTPGTISASSSSLATYDNFVTAQSGGATYNGSTITWHAIVSTTTTNARDNVGGYGTAVPVYLGNGTKVANDLTTTAANFGLWSGSVLSSPAAGPDGTALSGSTYAWTGSNANGTQNALAPVGAPSVTFGGNTYPGLTMYGSTGASTSWWLRDNTAINSTNFFRVYALSDTLTAAAVPEPSAYGVALGSLVLVSAIVRRRRCK